MPDTVNPYTPGQPVRDPQHFFGRREILASLRESLVAGRRVFLIAGAPRMGKSSLLRQIPMHVPDHVLTVRVELLEVDTPHLDWLLWCIADAIYQQVSQQVETPFAQPLWTSFEGHPEYFLASFWPQVRACLEQRLLLLLIDDLDALVAEASSVLQSSLSVFSQWRDADGHVAFCMSASVGLAEELPRAVPNLFGGATPYRLEALSGEEALRLITWPVDGVITYDYGVPRRLIEITSGHPYYLHLLCFQVFQRCAAAGWVNQHDLDVLLDEIRGREIPEFRSIWDESTNREQAVLAAMVSLRGARGVATILEVRTVLTRTGQNIERGLVAEALESLANRGILQRLGALSYRFRVGLLRDWLHDGST